MYHLPANISTSVIEFKEPISNVKGHAMTDRALPSVLGAAPPRRRGFLSTLLNLDARHRQHRALGRLDALRLRDLGLDETEIARETGRPFWDAPAWWR